MATVRQWLSPAACWQQPDPIKRRPVSFGRPAHARSWLKPLGRWPAAAKRLRRADRHAGMVAFSTKKTSTFLPSCGQLPSLMWAASFPPACSFLPSCGQRPSLLRAASFPHVGSFLPSCGQLGACCHG
eukprot:360503-Chlamydomonas_euryale.AAC.5